jgi:hypothetical protein
LMKVKRIGRPKKTETAQKPAWTINIKNQP